MRKVFAALLISIFLFLTNGYCRSVDVDLKARPRSGVDVKVTELLIMAMRARDAGDMNSAELLWIQAKAFKPSIRRPIWLDQVPETRNDVIALPEKELFARIASMPYDRAKLLLEERLSKDPGNIPLRQAYLDMAEKNSDLPEISRHRSILQPDSFDLITLIQYVLVSFLLLILILQLGRLYRDLHTT